MKAKLKLQLLLPVLLGMSVLSQAQGTAFSYQGRLMEDAVAANGTYDFIFTLLDAEVGGNAVAGPVSRDGLPVAAGQFVVPLDFGAGAFEGAARWLEIGVRVNGAAQAHTILAPRQALLPTPYAIYAGRAGGVANGTVTADQLRTGGQAPAPGQFLSYSGGNLIWTDPAVAAGDTWSPNGPDIFYNAGRVGIGTRAPLTPLEVNGVIRSTRSGVPVQYIELNGGNSGSIKLTAQSTSEAEKNLFIENLSGEAVPGANNNLQFVLGTTAAPSTKMTIDRDGDVGIGALNPRGRLHLYDSVGSVSHRIETGGDVNAWTRVDFANANGQWDVGTSRGYNGDEFYIHREGSSVNAFGIDASGLAARFATADLALGHPLRRGTPGRALVDFTDRLIINYGDDWASTVIGGAVTEVRTLRITGGADVAEPFEIKEGPLEKGSVVVIDGENPGRLMRSTAAYDTRVAGIVSGAKGIQPGIALHQEGALGGGQNVALSGRVYVQADASGGGIHPGDLLTTSDTPGHAMKVLDPSRAQGAILGKAMTGLMEGKGLVLVLVTLQ